MKNLFGGGHSSGPEDKKPQFSDLQNKRVYYSKDLFQNDREVIIVHNDICYKLLITKAGKLILNK